MNAAYAIYPNQSEHLSLNQRDFSITWIPEADEIVIETSKSTRTQNIEASKINLVVDENDSRTQSTYSINIENNQLKLKYMDGHRVQKIKVDEN